MRWKSTFAVIPTDSGTKKISVGKKTLQKIYIFFGFNVFFSTKNEHVEKKVVFKYVWMFETYLKLI